MKAELECEGLEYRGVILTSENQEESWLLERLWDQNGRAVCLSRINLLKRELTVAPTPASNKEANWIMSWVYKKSEANLWTVGFYEPDGTWVPESDHDDAEKAASRCNYLNGGNDA